MDFEKTFPKSANLVVQFIQVKVTLLTLSKIRSNFNLNVFTSPCLPLSPLVSRCLPLSPLVYLDRYIGKRKYFMKKI